MLTRLILVGKVVLLYLGVGMFVPLLLLLSIVLLPFPYSEYIASFAVLPAQYMPFMEDRLFLRELSLSVFGRQLPNYAYIYTLLMFVFWFFAAIVFLLLERVMFRLIERLVK